jgi:hypothetical protein
MRTYVMVTGAIFGLLVLVHLWRMVEEGPRVATDPWYLGVTLIAAALAVWALRLARATPTT